MKQNKALLIFNDDSSLFVGGAFCEQIERIGWRCDFMNVSLRSGPDSLITARQLGLVLDESRMLVERSGLDACDEALLCEYDIVVSAKYPLSYRAFWMTGAWRFLEKRPCFVALFPGIELKRPLGSQLRRYADIVCFPTQDDLAFYRSSELARPSWQVALRYHPRLLSEPGRNADAEERKVAVFFTQSVVPYTLSGRMDVAGLLLAAAEANPDWQIIVKLRHRTDENRRHTHRERYGFEWMMEEQGGVPSNMVFDDGTAESAISRADVVITCSSTAGFEAVASGVRTLFYLDYPDAEKDPLNLPARNLLAGSGLLGNREDVLALNGRLATQSWADSVISKPDDLKQLLTAVKKFRQLEIPYRASWPRAVLGRGMFLIVRAYETAYVFVAEITKRH